MTDREKRSKALTWDDLADDYKKVTGRSARVRPMEEIFNWAERQTKRYLVDPDEGTLHRRPPSAHLFVPPTGRYCAICGYDIEAHTGDAPASTARSW